ncbi:MAG: prepilin-type N-terminal cleavage/methylation domain-containing protein, partial [Planctomycetota bacterium]
MKMNKRQSGVTFMEMTVVIAVVALLVGISIPAVRALRGSFESEGGTKVMINAALSAARAIAAKEHNYAGV